VDEASPCAAKFFAFMPLSFVSAPPDSRGIAFNANTNANNIDSA
jgi:hypothetical protein